MKSRILKRSLQYSGLISDQTIELQETPLLNDAIARNVNYQRPKHPEYAVEARRIHSFRGGYVPRGQTVEVLARAGFYYVGTLICYY